jgi:hypothetical protein
MNTVNIETTNPEPLVLNRQIGSTTFRVNLHFNHNAKETLVNKIYRLLKNDLQTTPENAKIESLQASWLSERSSL